MESEMPLMEVQHCLERREDGQVSWSGLGEADDEERRVVVGVVGVGSSMARVVVVRVRVRVVRRARRFILLSVLLSCSCLSFFCSMLLFSLE